MKKQSLTRSPKVNSSKPRRLKKPLVGLESLEDRHLLAANVLSSVNDSIATPGQVDDINLMVDLAGSGGSAALVFHAVATSGSSVNLRAPVIKTLSGSVISPVSSLDNADGLNGRSVIELGDGSYSVEVSAEGVSTGAYRLEVSLLGDVAANDRTVGSFEKLRASAALIQFAGTGNHVTDLFYLQHGINMSVNQYDTGFDVNMDGGVDPFELGIVDRNQNAVVSFIELQADVTGPAISNFRLTNDTGVSGTDRISIDPRVQGRITDENTISRVTASLDGGAAVDITADLGTFTNSVDFVLTASVLDRVAGGTLAAGPHTLTISATDEFDNSSSAMLTFTYIPTNSSPTSNVISQRTATEDSAFSFNASTFFSDSNPGDVLTFTATGRPSWLSITPQGVLSGTPGDNDVATSNIMITATDSQGATTTQPVILVVNNTPDPPVIQPIADQFPNEREMFSLDIRGRVTDPDAGDVPEISVDRVASMTDIRPLTLPAWLTYNATTGILSGTPMQADVGTTTLIRVFVVDQIDGTGSDDEFFSITVIDVGDPPRLDMPIPNDTVQQRDPYSINFNDFFSDPDPGDTLTYTATADGGALPTWLSLNSSTGVMSGTPTNESDVDKMLAIVVTATDSSQAALMATGSYVLTVENVNDAPVVADQTFRVEPGAASGTVVGTIAFSDPDNDPVAITVDSGTGQSLFNVNSASGQITVAPNAVLTNMQVLTLNITITDAGSPQMTDTAVITINVTDNLPPNAVDDSGFETEDFALPLTIDASDLLANDTDPDNDMLTITNVQSTSDRGASVSFNPQTNQISYDSAASDELLALRPGEQVTDTFTYTISDGNLEDTATVTVNVIGTDTAEFFLEFFDATGTAPVTSLNPGQQFTLIVSVQDRRPEKNQNDGIPNNDIPAGIFAAFLDVTYPTNMVSTSGPIVHLAPYDAIMNGNLNTPGLIDEAGGADGLSPLGPDKRQIYSVLMTAGQTAGTATFASDPVEDQGQFGILAYLENRTIPNQQIIFDTSTIVIAGLNAPLSGSAPATNFDNPFDVDGDNLVALKDAIIVINGIQTGHFDNNYFPDVNADGRVVLQDAVQVLNAVQLGVPQAAMSGSATAGGNGVDDSDDAHASLVDSIFADLG